MNCLILKVPCYLLLLCRQYDCCGSPRLYNSIDSRRHIAPTIYDNTLLSGNSNVEHGKHGGTTAKRYPSLHTKTFLKLLHRNSEAVTSSASYSESYSTCLISFYHHPLICQPTLQGNKINVIVEVKVQTLAIYFCC